MSRVEGIPLTWNGVRIGTARLSEDGTFEANLKSAGAELYKMTRDGHITGLSVGFEYLPVAPVAPPLFTYNQKRVKGTSYIDGN